jgi:hypothetical protein
VSVYERSLQNEKKKFLASTACLFSGPSYPIMGFLGLAIDQSCFWDRNFSQSGVFFVLWLSVKTEFDDKREKRL